MFLSSDENDLKRLEYCQILVAPSSYNQAEEEVIRGEILYDIDQVGLAIIEKAADVCI